MMLWTAKREETQMQKNDSPTGSIQRTARSQISMVTFDDDVSVFTISDDSSSVHSDLDVTPSSEDDAPESILVSKKVHTIFYYLGYSVGMGTIWRFPYMCYTNGGGTFLIIFLVMLLLCGIPVFYVETVLGQFTGNGFIRIYDICPFFRGAGFAVLIVNVICSSYYTVLVIYATSYMYASFESKNIWDHCGYWADEKCLEMNRKINGTDLENDSKEYETAQNQFLHKLILEASEEISLKRNIVTNFGIPLILTYLCNILVLATDVEKASIVLYCAAALGYIMLTVLFVRATTLPGSVKGIHAYVFPKWKDFLNIKIWVEATIQALFSVGTGFGIIIVRSSSNRIKHSFKKEVIFVPLLSAIVSILSGGIVYLTFGYLSHGTGIPISSVASFGPGTVYVAYCTTISQFRPLKVSSFFFFSCFVMVGISSIYIQIHYTISSILDMNRKFRHWRKIFVLVIITIMFICSTTCLSHSGIHILKVVDWYAAPFTIVLVCFIEVFTVMWVYGSKKFILVVKFMSIEQVYFIWPVLWRVIAPIILLFVFIVRIIWDEPLSYDNLNYPKSLQRIGWLVSALSMVCIPGYALYKLTRTFGKSKSQIGQIFCPKSKFGPRDKLYQRQWDIYYSLYLPKTNSCGDGLFCIKRHNKDTGIGSNAGILKAEMQNINST